MLPRFLAIALVLILTSAAGAQAPLVAPTNWKSPADEKKGFKLPPGFEAQLVASEPDILKPMQMAFDHKGRLWVAMSQEYPYAAIGRKGKDRLMVLSDFGADGKATKVETFADELNIPIGVLPLPDGKTVLVSSIDPGPEGAKQPDGCWIWELKDTNGDGKADERHRLFGPFGTRDTHGMVNSFTLMPDGWVYACHGYANDSKVKGRDGHEVTMNSGHTFRFRPNGSRIEIYTRGQVNPFGMTYDTWFNFYTADCHSKPMTQLIRGAVYQSFGKPHDGLGFGPDMIRHDHGSTGLCGLAWYEADNFPKEFHGGMFLGNVVNSRINWDKIKFHGSTPEAVQQPDFLVSEDLWFRPVDIRLGPDGALWVSDFYNKIIGHYEVPLTHPGRDRTSGRIWRIVYTGNGGMSPNPPADLTKLKRDELDKLLGHPNIVLRMQATHALINSEERELEELEKLTDRATVYDAHKMWADEAEAIDERHNKRDKKRMELQGDTGLSAAHRMRLRTAQAEWEADHIRRGRDRIDRVREAYKADLGGPAGRACADYMTAVPKAENLPVLVSALREVPAADTHLRHAIRIALRETLRDPSAWPKLKDLNLKDPMVRAIADVVTGVPSKDAADYLTTHLSALTNDLDRLPAYIEHAARHGDGMKTIFSFVTTHKPDDVRLSVALFHAYQRGLQQKGGPRFDKADYEFAEKLVAKGLADSDAATNLRCFDMANGLKLKGSLELVSEFAARRDRNENLRAAAFSTLLALDAESGVSRVGRVLSSGDEPIVVRERAAQALGTVGTKAAYTELLNALERAPARLQTVIAASLAAKAEGAEVLLGSVAAGKASARLLQDRFVQTRLRESRVTRVDERIAELTKGLPSLDQKMAELMGHRRDGFAGAKTDVKLGAAVFKTNCANCHQLGGEGAKVGPQLDGIGSRGLDRLLEDILDPSRNVDQAFRSTILNLKDMRTVSGLVLREEGEVIVMADAQGKEIRIPKSDVEDRRMSLLSPMPANLPEAIKEQDFYNLMAFLLQQRAKDK
jgi:putative heme-binding domain-containing protein